MTHFHILESHKSMRIYNDKLSGVHEATDATLRDDTKRIQLGDGRENVLLGVRNSTRTLQLCYATILLICFA